ncbi:hypothetical protein A3H16_02835 [Candidatus Kaiserbacteria bacterium RIFCSPLOWO2_12_FULL_53_8]|uniref:Uncharacterized protein n=2 Tax=Candidatus Kaiseribacteriota TaxID=1752734 RepID=A0A1F6CU58_9BACT|nr:MAG: hypothetical protein A2851_05305 [Candidatus Kaiserbacteria bacterium RIFCSPHIGHO2_01_FULL_53_29]OGG92059.1 MAG: hypothetical protein A3H16_02835 [Candidatus Kaiserbacteria bacterium RIFCSPLOWO2_12_FULL_53_8]
MMGTPDSFDPNRKSKRLTVDEILAGVGERIEPGASSGTSEVPDAEIEVPSQIEELNEWRKNEWQKISDSDPQFTELRTRAAEVRDHTLTRAANDGYFYKGQSLSDPNLKGNIILRESSKVLSEDVRRHVMGSGLRARHFAREDYELEILLNILGSGVCDSEWAPLQGALYVSPYTSEPFVLLSNYDELLDGQKGYSTGDSRLRNLRAVYVNAIYEDLVPDLQKTFPWVTFVTADTINDEILKKKELPYRSYLDRMRFEPDTN